MKRHTSHNFTTIVNKNWKNLRITMTNNWIFIAIKEIKHSHFYLCAT